MHLTIRTSGPYSYIDEGQGPALVLLHGLFGALSNWTDVVRSFQAQHRVLIPLMPIYRGQPVLNDLNETATFVQQFMDHLGLENAHLVGNSLGGHVALLVALQSPHRVSSLCLTGSSGLFEAGMGVGFVKRGDYDFIRERVAFTFFSPLTASKELVDEVFELVNDRGSAVRLIKIARSAQQMNLAHQLAHIQAPTCLIWGLNDNITPCYVAHQFGQLLPHAELHFIDHCGHAPMMEQPGRFNTLLGAFLEKHREAGRVIAV